MSRESTHPFSYVLLAAAALSVLFYVLSSPETEDIPRVRAALQDDIRRVGPEDAYALLKERYADKNVDVKHNIAHLFGEALYAVEGVEGVTACDEEFEFGCYHGFFTRAVSREGVEVVRALDAVCHMDGDEAPKSACQHGIGHGLMEFFGQDRLSEALEACKMTDIQSPDAGCYTGVFMQYNVPLAVSEDGRFSVTSRPLLDPLRPYDPCPSLKEEFQPACYHELPQWWGSVIERSPGRRGALCEGAPMSVLRTACYSGLGGVVASEALYDPDIAEEKCDQMPSYEGKVHCLHSAAWSIYLSAGDQEGAKALCSRNPEAARLRCPPERN